MARGDQRRRNSNNSDSSRGSGSSGGYETAPERPSRPSAPPPPDPAAVAAAQAAWRNVAVNTPAWPSNRRSDPPNTYYMLNYTDRGLELLRSAGNVAWKAVTSEKTRQAVIEGAPFVVQGAGFLANRPDIIGAGVGLAALDGVKEVLTAAYRKYQIWAQPDQRHPNPNWYKAAAGVVNIVANSLYGRGNSGEGSMRLTGGSGVAVGASLMGRNLAPDPGYYNPPPPLPLYQQPNAQIYPLQSVQTGNPSFQVAASTVPYTATQQQQGSTSTDAQTAAMAALRRGNGNNSSAGNTSTR